MDSIGVRIDKTIKDSGLTQKDFAEKIGVSEQAIGNYINNRRFPKAEILLKMKQSFNTSVDWLLTGDSETIVRNETGYFTAEESQQNFNKKELLNKIEIPLIPIDAMAGFGEGTMQIMQYDTERYKVPEFTELNVDFMIRVKGSSMYPKYNSGDLVACKKLSLKDLFFQWNKVYVLDTEQGALIKRIKKSEMDNYIKIVSDNPSYDPVDLPLEKIYAVSLVVGVIRFE